MGSGLCGRLWLAMCVLLGLLSSCAVALQVAEITLVSVASSGEQGNHNSWVGDVSADGRHVVFSSFAENLDPGYFPWSGGVYVRDLTSGTTSLVSLSMTGQAAYSRDWSPCISDDGRCVAFSALSADLVPGDTNRQYDVFVHDRQTGQTTRVSVSSTGEEADGKSFGPSISADGRYVAFESLSSNLVPTEANGHADVFVRDRQTGTTTCASVSSAGALANRRCEYPAISADGRFVAFQSQATNLVDGDTNGDYDIFVHDVTTGTMTRASVSSTGAQGNRGSVHPSVSADGRYVAFTSSATDLAPGNPDGSRSVFIRDRVAGTTALLRLPRAADQEQAKPWKARISGDGRWVAFESSTGLVPNDRNRSQDVYVADRLTGTPVLVSVSIKGAGGNNWSHTPAISADGRFVVFGSAARDLVEGDRNGMGDTFVARLAESRTRPELWWAGTDGFLDDGVQPDRTDPDRGTFKFRVKITDQDDGPLRKQRLMIRRLDGPDSWKGLEPVQLGHLEGALAAGAIYGATTKLPNGVYRYRFSVTDEDGPAIGAPDQWQIGPRRAGTPFLYWSQKRGYKTDGVNPNKGPVGSTFILKVVYADGAGDAPTHRRLLIRRNGGLWRSLEMRGVEGGDRRLGKLYRKDVAVDKPGQYAYRFDFRDATGPATGEPTEWRRLGAVTGDGAGSGQVTAMSVMSTPAGAQVVFSLSTAAGVHARVLNLAGRPVKTLCTGRDCEAGANTLVWNATSDQGLRAPDGTYLVEVVARDEEGHETRGLAQVRIQR